MTYENFPEINILAFFCQILSQLKQQMYGGTLPLNESYCINI
uniref:Uncharacterized protein n=1 Tax=Anguilla anguilla TaxID=7936 RepID=A0A0E9PVG6_ANGAN